MSGELKQLVDKGIIDPTEVPFDEETENAVPEEVKKEKYPLPYTVKLEYPIVMGKQTIESVTFSRGPYAGECMALPLSGDLKWGHYVPLVSACTGETNAALKRMAASDFQNCMLVVAHFLVGQGGSDVE